MKITVLPSTLDGPERKQALTTYLIGDSLSVDAGALGIALPVPAQCQVSDIILTHAHLDHVATLPIFLDNVFAHVREPIRIHATEQTIEVMRRNVFNDLIWPDFSRLSNEFGPVMRFVPLPAGPPIEVAGLGVRAVLVNHPVPTVGLALTGGSGSFLITSDTTYTEEIWQVANELADLRAVFVDVSFPNRLEQLAAVSGHLTPMGLARELEKLRRPAEVFAVHLKPGFQAEVAAELQALGLPRLRVAEIGRAYVWD